MKLHALPARALVLMLALAACQPPTSTAGPTGGTPGPTGSPGPGGSGAASPAATSAPTGAGTPFPSLMSLELDDSGPIIAAGANGPEGFSYGLPAAGARDRDGGLVLFIVWFGEGDDDIMVTVSRSGDGRTWDVGTDSILDGVGVGVPDPGPIPSAALQLEDGSWLLYGWSSANDVGTSFATWRASAPEPEGPWTLDSNRILAPGLAGNWDAQMSVAASVQRELDGDGYLMWFEGEGPGSEVRGDIGLATSPDGLAWRKYDDHATIDLARALSDPVIATGICGAATGLAVEQPQVEVAGSGYAAVFGGFGAARSAMDLYGAVSADGRSWHCANPEALLRTDDIPGSQGMHGIASIPLGDGRIGLVIESIRDEHSELWWATVEVAE